MNTKQTKRIKRAVLGDYSHLFRKYIRVNKTGVIMNHPDSPRAKYQAAKKAFKTTRKEVISCQKAARKGPKTNPNPIKNNPV